MGPADEDEVGEIGLDRTSLSAAGIVYSKPMRSAMVQLCTAPLPMLTCRPPLATRFRIPIMGGRKERLQGRVGAFMRQYARRRQRGRDPNDRGYDREVEAQVKRLGPLELEELLEGADGLNQPPEDAGIE